MRSDTTTIATVKNPIAKKGDGMAPVVSLKKQHDVKKCCKEERNKKHEERDREEGFQKTGHNGSK